MKIFSITLIAASLVSGIAFAQQAAPAGNAENGKKHFISDGCWQCHGMTGNGAALTGPRLAQTQLPFDAFVMQLRQPSNDMPPYEAAVVTQQTAADIYAYVKSLPDSPNAKDVPLIMNMGVK